MGIRVTFYCWGGRWLPVGPWAWPVASFPLKIFRVLLYIFISKDFYKLFRQNKISGQSGFDMK